MKMASALAPRFLPSWLSPWVPPILWVPIMDQVPSPQVLKGDCLEVCRRSGLGLKCAGEKWEEKPSERRKDLG